MNAITTFKPIYFWGIVFLSKKSLIRLSKKRQLNLKAFEEFYTKQQKSRFLAILSILLLSIAVILIINRFSFIWAPAIGGIVYNLYIPLIIVWSEKFKQKSLLHN